MDNDNRIAGVPSYPVMNYYESLFLWLGGNYIYHQKIYRARQSGIMFAVFMAASAWTCFNITEAFNPMA